MVKLNWQHTRRFVMAALWMDLSSGMFVVALPYFAMSLGADSLQLGILGAVRGFAYMIACLGAALLAERTNRRLLIAISACACAITLMATGWVTSLLQLNVVSVLWALALSLFWPSVFGWLGDSHSKEQLGRATGVVNVCWSIGVMAGGVVAGWLFAISHALPFIAAGVPAILAGVVLIVGTTASQSKSVPAPAQPSMPGTKRRLAAAWLGNTTACCMIGLLTGVFPELGKSLGVTSAVFGVLVAVFGMGRTLVYLSALTRWRHLQDWRLAAVAQLAAAGMVATLSRASAHLWLAAVFAVMGFAAGAAYYLGLYRSLEGAGSRSLKSGMHEAALLAGLLVGALGGGILAKVSGLRAPYVPAACTVAALVVVQAGLNLSAGRARLKAAAAAPPEPAGRML